MKFIPRYRISYRGVFYKAGTEFEIDPADVGEMSIHGEIIRDIAPPPSFPEDNIDGGEKTAARDDKKQEVIQPATKARAGRPRKKTNGE